MPVISDHWEKFTDEDWHYLAERYLSEINENSGKEYDEEQDDDEYDEENKWSLLVTEFQFTSAPELQWKFIILTVSLAENDKQLGDIAAGGIEHLLGWYGEEYINLVELEAKINPKFAKALTGVWKYMMTDEVWARVQKLQSEAEKKLN